MTILSFRPFLLVTLYSSSCPSPSSQVGLSVSPLTQHGSPLAYQEIMAELGRLLCSVMIRPPLLIGNINPSSKPMMPTPVSYLHLEGKVTAHAFSLDRLITPLLPRLHASPDITSLAQHHLLFFFRFSPYFLLGRRMARRWSTRR